MDAIDIIKKAGLNHTQAEIYLALLETDKLTVAEIAKKTNINRTNIYNVLETLVKFNLVKRLDAKKQTFCITHPNNLELLAEKRRKQMAINEQTLEANLNSLIDIFDIHHLLPGARTYTGTDGVKKAYQEALAARSDVHFIRSTADVALPKAWWQQYRNKLKTHNIHTYGIVQDTPLARANISSRRNDEVGVEVVLAPTNAYTSPVAIQIYGQKVALIQFSQEETMTTIIDSPTIHQAFLQLWQLLATHFRATYPQEIAPSTQSRIEPV